MFFWFKRRKIILDCFTDNALVFDRHKIVKAVHELPDWYRSLPNEYRSSSEENGNGNMKHCHGFKEFFKKAFSINMWMAVDFEVDTDKKTWTWLSSTPMILGEHFPHQYGNFLHKNDYDHVKFINPWYLKTDRFVNFAWIDSFWCRNTHDYFFPNAVFDFYYQHAANINTFFRLNGPSYKFSLVAGQPLVFIVPLTEHQVEIKHHLLTEKEMNRFLPRDCFLRADTYKTRKKHTDKLLSRQKKCPFGFGS
jgi:hypothetical protein